MAEALLIKMTEWKHCRCNETTVHIHICVHVSWTVKCVEFVADDTSVDGVTIAAESSNTTESPEGTVNYQNIKNVLLKSNGFPTGQVVYMTVGHLST